MARSIARSDALRGSFLPEDYLRRKAERRSILILAVLLAVAILGLAMAFFVTYRQKRDITRQQEEINTQFAVENKKIEQLRVLEMQRAEMGAKADVTLALIEKVPRSILLAELINRMPKHLTLSEFNLKSKRITESTTAGQTGAGKTKPRSLAGPAAKAAAKTAKEKAAQTASAEEKPKPTAPKFEFKIELLGLSAEDTDVADYVAALQNCPLLEKIELVYSGETTVDDVQMRKFRIEAGIRSTADARTIEPLQVPRLASRPNVPGGGGSEKAAADAKADPHAMPADKSAKDGKKKSTATVTTKE